MKDYINIAISKLRAFEGHPYKVLDNEEMDALTKSVREHGVLSPLIVRPLEGTTDEYEVISGHRRLYAAQKAGMDTVPAFIHAVDRDAAAIELVDSNLHREHILPSEKAFAYKLKRDALAHQGAASPQLGEKLLTVELIGKETGDSKNQVLRYIRLTYLIPALLDMVDTKRIAFSVGVELSFLPARLQEYLVEAIALYDATPSYSQAVRMHRMCDERLFCLTESGIDAIMAEEKPNQRERLSLPMDRLRPLFPAEYTPKKMQTEIMGVLEENYRPPKKKPRDYDAR